MKNMLFALAVIMISTPALAADCSRLDVTYTLSGDWHLYTIKDENGRPCGSGSSQDQEKARKQAYKTCGCP